TGFLLIGWLGLPGTSVAAGMLNLMAAALALRAAGMLAGRDRDRDRVAETMASRRPASEPAATGLVDAPANRLEWWLLPVAFGTAVASFAYEIGWIRMLSLLLGSATHAFEIMLSAFILG